MNGQVPDGFRVGKNPPTESKILAATLYHTKIEPKNLHGFRATPNLILGQSSMRLSSIKSLSRGRHDGELISMFAVNPLGLDGAGRFDGSAADFIWFLYESCFWPVLVGAIRCESAL
jgi:hypothetical protein